MGKEKTQFKKGNNANPKGAGAHNPITKTIKKLSNEQVAEVGTILLNGTKEDLQKITADPNSSILKLMVASVAAKAIRNGDSSAMQAIMDRIAGRIPSLDAHVLMGPGGGPIEYEVRLSEEQKVKALESALNAAKKNLSDSSGE